MTSDIERLVAAVRQNPKASITTLALCDAIDEAGHVQDRSIIVAIAEGLLDDQLEAIQQMIRIRREALATATVAGLRIGDRVKIVGSIRPRYLVGMTGSVVETGLQRTRVQLDRVTRRYGRYPVGVPNSCIGRA